MFQKTVDTIAFPFDRYGTVTEFRDGEERGYRLSMCGQELNVYVFDWDVDRSYGHVQYVAGRGEADRYIAAFRKNAEREWSIWEYGQGLSA